MCRPTRSSRLKWSQALASLAALLIGASLGSAQTSVPPGPWSISATSAFTATLVPAASLRFRGEADSNSPAVWELVDGLNTLFVLTSINGSPSLSAGADMWLLSRPEPVVFVEHPPPGGTWMEAVVRADEGTWYGYYHNEVEDMVCPGSGKVIPRIGAARSTDMGRTWHDLGVILEGPPDTERCDTTNKYFVGGVGDFSVQLDHDHQYLYVFFTQYPDLRRTQGVAVARMVWADRDEPVGKVEVWRYGAWIPPSRDEVEDAVGAQGSGESWIYEAATPIYRTLGSWHDDEGRVSALWGPSVHWNRSLQQYVMLLNRARDMEWSQEGIYVSFAPTLDDPRAWSLPERILQGGLWYPQVMGLQPGEGTDKLADNVARFYMGGVSNYVIHFSKR